MVVDTSFSWPMIGENTCQPVSAPIPYDKCLDLPHRLKTMDNFRGQGCKGWVVMCYSQQSGHFFGGCFFGHK